MADCVTDEFIPISALQHFVYCRRQAALIHVEQQWSENVATVAGRQLHEKSDVPATESRSANLRIARSVPLCNERIGIVGIADVVEFHRDSTDLPKAVVLPGNSGRWIAVPVEYKRGGPKKHDADRVQLCAQAMCLEEMLDTTVGEGYLFYARTRRRMPVPINAELRRRTEDVAERMHALLRDGVTPEPEPGPKCEQCSLRDVCLPDLRGKSASRYVTELMRKVLP